MLVLCLYKHHYNILCSRSMGEAEESEAGRMLATRTGERV
jgi:hypothetical protein